jgi:transposase InsO family protein
MPWLETSPVQQRKEFIEAVKRREHSFSELCRRFRISRKNGYKWWNRYLVEEARGRQVSFEDRSRRPRRSPSRLKSELEEAIVALRKKRPHWGPKKLRAVLKKANPKLKWPSESTFADVLKRNGLVKPRRKRNKLTPYTAPLEHAARPNAVWSIDFKGDFAVGRTRCYPLTVTDAYSRYIIGCVALTSTQAEPARRALMRIFDEYGLPEAIRSDNGTPFSSKGVGGLSRLSVWWHKLGIRHERIEPGHPEQNGRHERMHLDLHRETASPPAVSIARQQRRLDQFRARFNNERPHEALGQRTPSELYQDSPRRLPEPPWGRAFEYDYDDDVASVSRLGYVNSRAGTFFLSTVLAHEPVLFQWLDRKHARVVWHSLLLGDLHVERKPKRARFIPVEEVTPIRVYPDAEEDNDQHQQAVTHVSR